MDAAKASSKIHYFNLEGCLEQFFRCSPYHATLSKKACARRWKEAQGSALAMFEKCRSCPVGAGHAGQVHVQYSILYGAMICERCGVGTTRMIRGELCVSCYNREREVVNGRNGKGTKPVKTKLEPRVISYVIERDGIFRLETYLRRLCADSEELMVHVLRTAKGRIMFGAVRYLANREMPS